MTGYSGTPLAKKLGIKPGAGVHAENAPPNYAQLVAPLPDGATLLAEPPDEPGFVHLFVTSRRELEGRLAEYRGRLAQDGTIWVSWPKRAANVPTDVTEDVVREVIAWRRGGS